MKRFQIHKQFLVKAHSLKAQVI